MALTSSLFSNDPRIHEAHANRMRPIGVGEPQSISVARLQAALKHLGFPLPISSAGGGLDGVFGRETRDAVVGFQQRNGLKPDGLVGHDTLEKMDAMLRGLPPVPPPGPPRGSSITPDMATVNAADMRRLSALRVAIERAGDVVRAFSPGVPDPSNPTVQAIQRQMFFPPDSSFWPRVDQLIGFMQTNLTIRTHFIVNRSANEYAHVDLSNDPGRGITFGGAFFQPDTSDNCRHEVITHEFFHFVVGLQHFYGARDPESALKCPHHLARAVFDIAQGQRTAPCDRNLMVCR